MKLDIDLLRSFVGVADAKSFTAAGNLMGATQSAMSVRLKKLEDRLGQQLMVRSPRALALTAFGEAFLGDARTILAAHDAAVRRVSPANVARAIDVGISDQAAGARLPAVIARLRSLFPPHKLSVTVGRSEELAAEFRAGRFEAAVIRGRPGAHAGEALYSDPLIWVAASRFSRNLPRPLPLILLNGACGLREAAIQALEEGNIDWDEVFSGTGVAAVQAAVTAGLGVACVGRCNRLKDMAVLGPDDGLPLLPKEDVVLLHRGRETLPEGFAEALRTGLAGTV